MHSDGGVRGAMVGMAVAVGYYDPAVFWFGIAVTP